MALPKWITPAGQLGIVPELDYYEFPLDAYDASGGTLVYSLVSGRLPLGLQIVPTGRIQGIPVSERGQVDVNIDYRFTVRVTNSTTNELSDRTFVITITNVAPPVIVPGSREIKYNLIELAGNIITANVDAIASQPSSGATSSIIFDVANSAGISIIYDNENIPFVLGSGNIFINGQDSNAYPISSRIQFFEPAYNLGLFLDGDEVEIQLEALEFTPGTAFTWSISSGEIPEGLTLSSTGLLSGYVVPIDDTNFRSIFGRDESGNLLQIKNWNVHLWDEFGWSSPLRAISKTFTFTVDAFDGVKYDRSLYTLTVYPRSSLTADNDDLPVSTETLASGVRLSIDYGNKHNPIIQTTQANLPPVRQGSYFSFNIDSIDLDGDVVNYNVPTLINGAFDEQVVVGETPPYVTDYIVNNTISSGIYPRVTVSNIDNVQVSQQDFVNVNFEQGDDLKVLGPDNFWYTATITDTATVRLRGNTNLTASAGQFITQASSGANATITNVSVTTGTVNLTGNIYTGFVNVELPTYNITFSGNITANVGQFITQSISGANARVLSTATNTASVLYIIGRFTNGAGTVAVDGSARTVFPTANVKAVTTRTITANVGDTITQTGATGNAVITSITEDAVSVPVEFRSGSFSPFAGNIRINGTDANVIVTSLIQISNPFAIRANVGDYVTQGTANARITANVFSSTELSVQFIANTFTINGSNVQINGGNVNGFPSSAVYQTDVALQYNNLNTFDVGSGIVSVNGISTNSNVSSYVNLGATLGLRSEEGTVGFDETKFDQGTLSLPEGLRIDLETGWIYGQLQPQTINQIDYEFEIVAFKRDDPTYNDRELYTLTVLGDLNNRIEWITPSDLGTIENGELSDLFVTALHTNPGSPKTLYYNFKPGSAHQLPQGLSLTSSGLLSGRVSFMLFSLDNGVVTIDGGDTTFDNTYTFTVTASAVDGTISADRTFTVRVLERNKLPFENLYLKALPTTEQRTQFTNIIRNTDIFPLELIYRTEDPYYGLAKDIKTLFLPGLNPTALEDYVSAASTNHFRKRILFGEVKTARALDTNFNVKYEVVYLEIKDENTTIDGKFPASTQLLDGLIANPYYDANGNSYTTAYPNAFGNMELVMVGDLGYANKGALPDWMTSRQADGRVLGFTRAVVLAYTKPDASALIAYRLRTSNYNLNEIDFTVDRYQLDNILTNNYDVAAGEFLTSTETTFDRYPGLSSIFVEIGTVDFALRISFEQVNKNTISTIIELGGFDGLRNIKSGQTIVFAEQEFFRDQNDIGNYNQGWSQVQTLWDEDAWDSDNPIVLWDQSGYVPGFNENNFNPTVANQRIGIWEVAIDEENIVTLTFVRTLAYYEKLYVRNGFTYGGTNIYYDPIVKPNNIIPNYSIIPQQIKIQYTTFDGNGTRFYNNRDEYVLPGTGDKYIKFTKTGVFT